MAIYTLVTLTATQSLRVEKRQNCPADRPFYRCQNGFAGCCSVNPCDPGATCPDTDTGTGLTTTSIIRSTSTRSITSTTQLTLATPFTRPTDFFVSTQTPTSSSATTSSTTSSTQSPTPTVSSAATSDTPASKPTPVGAIAGGVVGGLAFLVLLLLLCLLCVRRRRKKVRENHAAITHKMESPLEYQAPFRESRERGGKDVFAPYGGYYRGLATPADSSNEKDGQISYINPGERAEADSVMLPAAKYHNTSRSRTPYVPVMLDSTPVMKSTSRGSSPRSVRSGRFVESVVEMADTSPSRPPPTDYVQQDSPVSDSDSPTLGRGAAARPGMSLGKQTRLKQHLMSWNNYNANSAETKEDNFGATMSPSKKRPGTQSTLASAKGSISPDMSDSPVDKSFVTSPLASTKSSVRSTKR